MIGLTFFIFSWSGGAYISTWSSSGGIFLRSTADVESLVEITSPGTGINGGSWTGGVDISSGYNEDKTP